MQGFNMRLALTNVLVLACLAVTGQTALAVLGETEAELVKRYGRPDADAPRGAQIAPADKALSWSNHRDYKVTVYLKDGRSVHERYVMSRIFTKPQDEIVMGILKDNALGEKWEPLNDETMGAINFALVESGRPSPRYMWVQRRSRSDAIADKDDPHLLEVSSKQWVDALMKR